MNAKRLIKQVLYEKTGKNLILFYKVDVSISENMEDIENIEQQIPQQEPQQQPMQPQPEMGLQPQMPMGQEIPANQIQLPPGANEDTIYEETFTSVGQGKLLIPEDDVDNIQSLEDLFDYLSKKNVKGQPVLNDAISEIVLNMAAGGPESIADLINKDDKILINIDYGMEKDNSVGLKATKSSGVNTLSLVMKKDNKVLPGPFSLQEFNKMVVFYRNSLLTK